MILESHDLQSWEYVNEYQLRAKNEQVRQLVDALGVDASKLESLMGASVTEANINEFGRFDELKKTVDREKARGYYNAIEDTSIPEFRLSIKIEKLLKDFILRGGFNLIEDANE